MLHHCLGWGSLLHNCVESLINLHRLGHEADLFHVLADLFGNLLQDLLGKVSSLYALLKLNKLNNIARADLSSSGIFEWFVITVKSDHVREFFVADTNDNNGYGHVSTLTDLVDNLLHIVDFTVSQNEQDLVSHGVTLLFDHCHELIDDLTKVSGS